MSVRRFGSVSKMGAGAAAALLVGLGLGSTPAWAYYAYNSSDYASTYSSDTQVKVCDMEADTNAVEVEYHRNYSSSSSHLWDKNGAGPENCAYSGSGNIIYKMRVCEQRFAEPDSCGGYAYRS